MKCICRRTPILNLPNGSLCDVLLKLTCRDCEHRDAEKLQAMKNEEQLESLRQEHGTAGPSRPQSAVVVPKQEPAAPLEASPEQAVVAAPSPLPAGGPPPPPEVSSV